MYVTGLQAANRKLKVIFHVNACLFLTYAPVRYFKCRACRLLGCLEPHAAATVYQPLGLKGRVCVCLLTVRVPLQYTQDMLSFPVTVISWVPQTLERILCYGE